MNITPALPNPYQPPAQQERDAVAAVRATTAVRDATDDHLSGQRRGTVVDEVERDQVAARAGVDELTRHDDAHSAHANRALASYGQVAGVADQAELRNLLGFDAYA